MSHCFFFKLIFWARIIVGSQRYCGGNAVDDQVGGLSFDALYAMFNTHDQEASDCWTVIM